MKAAFFIENSCIIRVHDTCRYDFMQISCAFHAYDFVQWKFINFSLLMIFHDSWTFNGITQKSEVFLGFSLSCYFLPMINFMPFSKLFVCGDLAHPQCSVRREQAWRGQGAIIIGLVCPLAVLCSVCVVVNTISTNSPFCAQNLLVALCCFYTYLPKLSLGLDIMYISFILVSISCQVPPHSRSLLQKVWRCCCQLLALEVRNVCETLVLSACLCNSFAALDIALHIILLIRRIQHSFLLFAWPVAIGSNFFK